jgi:4-hydroxy-tetrahydrodipicolinate reductase
MGRLLVQEVLAADGLTLAAATAREGDSMFGKTVAPGVLATDDASELFRLSDVVIDFTLPTATIAHARLAGETGTALLVGTTGLGAAEREALAHASRSAPVLVAANTSLGVVLMQSLVRQAAASLGEDWDIEIVEMHHRHKIDAPSGTAWALGQAAAEGRKVDLDAVSDRGRDGHTGARKTGAIGFASLRGGDVVGEHTVIYAGASERIELTHKANDRRVFAVGALRAARWLAGRPAGAYRMAAVLGLG